MINSTTKKEFLKYELEYIKWKKENMKKIEIEYITWKKYEDIPQFVKKDIIENQNSCDIVTPFKENGKDWLFENLYKYQPRTGKILKESGDLFAGVELDEGEIGNTFLGIECNGKLIEIERDFYGNNLCDNDEENKIIREISRFNYLPEKIKKSYFYKFSGFGVNNGIGYVLPCNSWDSFDGYMDS